MCRHGFFESDKEQFKPFVHRKDELSIQDDILLWGNRIIIPHNGQKTLLTDLHMTHPGIVKMRSLARPIMWWSRVHINYAGLINGKMIPIIIDSHSKWIYVFTSTTSTSNTTIEHRVLQKKRYQSHYLCSIPSAYLSNKPVNTCRSFELYYISHTQIAVTHT